MRLCNVLKYWYIPFAKRIFTTNTYIRNWKIWVQFDERFPCVSCTVFCCALHWIYCSSCFSDEFSNDLWCTFFKYILCATTHTHTHINAYIFRIPTQWLNPSGYLQCTDKTKSKKIQVETWRTSNGTTYDNCRHREVQRLSHNINRK